MNNESAFRSQNEILQSTSICYYLNFGKITNSSAQIVTLWKL